MVDSFEKFSVMGKLTGPVAIAFDITTKCNLKCVHCYNNSGKSNEDEFTDEEVIAVAKQIVEIKPLSVCLCGGETLCRNNIIEILKILKDSIPTISMVSNGYIMTDSMIKDLKENGIEQIQISLDGADKYQHDSFRGVKGSFDKAVNALKLCKENNIYRVATSFVPNKLNYKSFEKYVELCSQIGVNSVRVMPFIPSGRGKSIGRSLMLDDNEYFEFIRCLLRMTKKYCKKLSVEWGDPLDHMRRMPYNAEHGIKAYSLDIKANGDIMPTTYLPIVIGNCKKHTLKEYWDSGYDFIWKNKEFTSQINRIKNIYDFDTFTPTPYSGEKIYINIL